MKKSTKRLVISSEAENSNGFHVRTAGIELADFKANPLLLWMHVRPKGERADEILPLGFWEDIEVENGKITGVPVFDDTDPFAMKIYNKVENGTIRMGSAGLKPGVFLTENGKKWLSTSTMKEASLVDIGSNKECLAVALYDDNDEIITLAEAEQKYFNPKNKDMKLITLSENTTALLKLAETATEADAHSAILNLVTLSESQKSTIASLEAAKKKAEDDLAAQVNLANKEALVTLVDKAVESRKITADQKETFIKLGEADFGSTKKLLDGMVGVATVNSQLGKGGKEVDELIKLSYEELDKSNKLVILKEKDPEAFKEKYKAKFGVDYKG